MDPRMTLIITIAIIVVGCIVLLYISKSIFKQITKKKNRLHIKFIESVIEVLIFTIGCYFVLTQFEFTRDFSKTLLQSSALIIAIATFAAQQALGNVISGIAISISKPFDIGDKIKVVNGSSVVSEGIVTDINLRHTTIRKFDGQCDLIPNGIMDNSVITNTNKLENVGNFVEVEISYTSDVDKAQEIMKDIIVNNDKTLNTPEGTGVLVKGFTANGLIIRSLVTTGNLDDSFKACSEIRKEILKQFNENGIVIPYQTVVVHNHNEN